MRHLIDTYIEADEPRTISPFDNMGLLDLIVKTGIANAIAKKLGGMKGNRNAIAETIENNVRSMILKEHLNDPAFYEKISALGFPATFALGLPSDIPSRACLCLRLVVFIIMVILTRDDQVLLQGTFTP
jgi:hypothetical protein